VFVLEADSVPRYARVVPGAVKGEAERIVPTIMDPRMDFDRLVLFDADQPVDPLPLEGMPEPSPSRATVAAWEPGRMTITLDPPPPAAGYVVVAENWYPDWRAAVDGQAVTVLRGNQTLLTVPVPAGARRVELVFRSAAVVRGSIITAGAALLVVGALVAPGAVAWARRRRA
jgi:hypothetical protein